MKNICVILGTRPEIIKLYPIVENLKKKLNKKKFNLKTLYTNQHKEMGKELSNLFKLRYDIMLNRDYKKNISFDLIDQIHKILKKNKIHYVVVMGDTLTGAAGSIAAYLNKSKIFYVESGLRTGDFNEPWPEEGFRKIITHISNIHFAPTKDNRKILISEGIKAKNIYVTGNTVIDTIQKSLKYINNKNTKKKLDKKINDILGQDLKNFVLITIHRRENFGKPFEKICENINRISAIYKNLKFVYPVHPNPYVKKMANLKFKKNKNIILTKPMNYDIFLRMLTRCKFILSDSGGIQEECSVLNKFVILLRNKTERPEIENKLVFVSGSDYKKFKKNFTFALSNKPFKKFSKVFGDGNSAQKISKIIIKQMK